MTQRERQILKWIEENPLISQQELAEKAGITRSSAAVHISNLMKQGHIAGKGYIVRTAPYAVVVGGVNLDIGGRSFGKLVPADSNPGQVRTSLGGVGRNIAHNMALLGMDVKNGWRIFRRDRYCHASPNSAQTESACAGLLELRLAGDAWYHGVLHKKPHIGDPVREIEHGDIPRACRLLYATAALALVLCAGCRALAILLL